MQRFIRAVTVALFLTASFPVSGGPFEDGIGALDSGDYEAAVAAFEEGALAGHVQAMVELATLYLSGNVPDRVAAATWLAKASEGGSVDALYLYGKLLLEGVNNTPEPARAVPYLESAAEARHAAAAYELGRMSRAGIGVKRDPEKAARYLRQAAEGQVLEAEHALGAMLAFGEGVPPNLIEGGMWMMLAARSGDADVASDLDRLSPLLSAKQTVEIERRIREHTDPMTPVIGGDHVHSQ